MNRLGHTKPIGPLVAEEIRAEMARNSMTISHLAQQLPMSRSTLSRKLNQTGDFTPGELSQISAAIGIPASDLMRRAEDRRAAKVA